MNESSSLKSKNAWRTRCFLVIFCWAATTVLMSIPVFRGMVIHPLYVHQEDASGDAAYVMAGGPASWERLRAAADLYHMKRVKKILVLKEHGSAGYNFVRKKTDSRWDRTVDALALYGVPSDVIVGVPENQSASMGSLSEARGVAENFPDVGSLVVVTSAPHTRRSRLCFQRSLPANTPVQVYAASTPADSAENGSPIWIEYAKLLVYYFAA